MAKFMAKFMANLRLIGSYIYLGCGQKTIYFRGESATAVCDVMQFYSP
ncbi:MAG: hypothetical protein WCO45_19415 [Pseudanabaena sp. ELA607]